MLHDGLTNKLSFNYIGNKFILKHLSPKKMNNDQIKMKTKRDKVKDVEKKSESLFIKDSSYFKSLLLIMSSYQNYNQLSLNFIG